MSLQWPTESVREQVAALCKDRPTVVQMVDHHGLVLTKRQRDIIETWEEEWQRQWLATNLPVKR